MEKLTQPLEGDSPAGPDLEYDPAFAELDRISKGKPEQQYGDKNIPAEEPDWREVKRQSLALLERTRDLRVLVKLAQAETAQGGLAAFAGCARVARGWLDGLWSAVHPRLDPDDNDDPTMRNNALVGFCDHDNTLRLLRESPLVRSRTLGTFSIRDVLVANRVLPAAAGAAAPDANTIEAAFKDSDLEDLRRTVGALAQAMGDVEAIEAMIFEKCGAERAIDLAPLRELLKPAHEIAAARLAARDGSGAAAASAAGPAPPAGGAAAAGLAAPSGQIAGREEAIRLMDKVCEWFERNEPSSPVPILLQRARRLVGKPFMDILKDLTPDAVAQAELFRGGAGAGVDSGSGTDAK